MSATPGAFNRGLLAGALLIVGAYALYWFVSGSDQGASSLRVATVIGQAAIGLGGCLVLWLREQRLNRE